MHISTSRSMSRTTATSSTTSTFMPTSTSTTAHLLLTDIIYFAVPVSTNCPSLSLSDPIPHRTFLHSFTLRVPLSGCCRINHPRPGDHLPVVTPQLLSLSLSLSLSLVPFLALPLMLFLPESRSSVAQFPFPFPPRPMCCRPRFPLSGCWERLNR
jgi:hypothetical protein